MDSNKNNKNLFLRFWHSNSAKISIVRDVFFALLFVLIILIALWAYTGQWFNAQPMVAIESNSMKHQNEPYGRLGTIDAGDMVLLVKVDERSDIIVRGSVSYRDDPTKDRFQSYGDYGDVIVYKPYGNEDETPVIHRAICWVEYNQKYDTYTVEEYGIYNQTSIDIPQLGLDDYIPKKSHSGFITKGDNVTTNKEADQTSSQICDEPIKMEWVSGKARGELPWIGIINLFFNDFTNSLNKESYGSTLNNVPRDSFDCFTLLIEALILIPVGMDILSYYKDKKQDFLKHKFRLKKELNDLGTLTAMYWGAIIVLLFISHFLLAYHMSNYFQFIIMLFIHIIFLFFLKLEGKIFRTKDMQKWILLTALTGPVGMTIFYYSTLKETKN